MNHVVVTGGAGFIGSNLCRRLISNGDKVLVIDNLITSDGTHLKQFRNNPNFKFIKQDITTSHFALRNSNLDARIIRVFNTYGPGTSKNETRVVSRFLRNAKSNRHLPVEGNGKQTRTFCYVDDLIDALLLIAERGKKGEIYNAGGDIEISINELAKLVLFVTGSKSKIKHIPRPGHDHQGRRPDLSKLKSLGWQQTVGIYEGLKLTIDPALS